jgi:hypothetical protein
MPRLRKIPDEENAYCVVLQLEDGYELRVGTVREQVGSGMRHFWAKMVPHYFKSLYRIPC